MKCFICEATDCLITYVSKNDVSFLVCEYCFKNLMQETIKCSYCNKIVNENNSFYINAKIGKNGIICSDCENNGISVKTGSVIFRKIANNFKSYSYKPLPQFFKITSDDDDIYMGVELEIGNGRSYNMVRNFCDNHGGHIFYFKSDASIRGEGCEIVTHPATLAYHLSDRSGWKELFEDFLADGFHSGEESNTGLHIHVNKNALSASQIKKIDLVVNQWQALFECIGRRRANSYCAYHLKLHSQWGYSSDRYQSVNFRNHDTVEFRFFCGTNKIEELFASLESVKIIVMLTKSITYDDLYENETVVIDKMKEIMKAEKFEYFSKLMVEKTGDTSWQI